MNDTEYCIDVCNRLLRGERAAVESYDKALDRCAERPDIAGELQRIRGEHASAVNTLTENVRRMGGQPDGTSGAWGTFASVVQSSANLLGANSALESLQQGEKHGEGDYRDALGDGRVMPECKEMIASSLLPRTQQHIAAISRMQEAA